MVLRGLGVTGSPGMGMASALVFALDGAGLTGQVAVVTDGQLSGLVNKGIVVGEVSPEAAAGGPLGLVRDGDSIRIDVPGADRRPGGARRRAGRAEGGAARPTRLRARSRSAGCRSTSAWSARCPRARSCGRGGRRHERSLRAETREGHRARRHRAVGRLRERGRGARRHVHRRRGRRLRDHRAERQRQVLDPDGRHRHGAPPRRGADLRRAGQERRRQVGGTARAHPRARAPPALPGPVHGGQHHPRLLHVDEKHREGTKIRRLRARRRPLPRAQAAPQAGGGHPVRRPAADGGDRPRAGRRPEDPRRRRAVPRPRRGGRQAGVRRARRRSTRPAPR